MRPALYIDCLHIIIIHIGRLSNFPHKLQLERTKHNELAGEGVLHECESVVDATDQLGI